jgi:hypothetical protein
MKTTIITTQSGEFRPFIDGKPLPYSYPNRIHAEEYLARAVADQSAKRANADFWRNLDAEAYARGMRWASGHACGGNGYHRTKEAAERAAKRSAKKACPENPPFWQVHELENPAAARA